MSRMRHLIRACSLLTTFLTVQSDGDVWAHTNAPGVREAASTEVQSARPAEAPAGPSEASGAAAPASRDESSEAEAEAPVASPLPAKLEPGECSRTGRRRQIQGKIDPAVIRTASEQLDLPLGAGRYLSVNGQNYLFCLEMHYREPGSGPGAQGWHKGVTVFDAS
ncbi:MAG TPA: hypothetical protein VFS43_23170 [Polyangiaceae bacterium]|nr:hypothetical protein [Polyangiaceae bacterium]